MKALYVYENLDFERDKDSKTALKIGKNAIIKEIEKSIFQREEEVEVVYEEIYDGCFLVIFQILKSPQSNYFEKTYIGGAKLPDGSILKSSGTFYTEEAILDNIKKRIQIKNSYNEQ